MNLVEYDLQPLWLSFKLASMTTTILFVIGLPIAYYLAFSTSRIKPMWEALISMPLVLPPSVLGFYLLIAFNPQSGFGAWLLAHFDLRLSFSFLGILFGSIIFSLPFMVQALQAGLQSLPLELREAAYTLGQTRMQTLRRVLLPNMKSSILSGLVLSFAHTLGEFGVVLMIGGNIPGVTKVASIAIYDEVESLHYANAHFYSLVLVLLSFLILIAVYLSKRQFPEKNS
ncbi:molybdate ABC transporter permease subunit [Undibacterium sp. Ji22W]|uniref:molybdate ABC transporter permease subunit n=1 Tax=Undibacterium sp. Ji22W TaxID=3413038 RepID=UPI003BF1A6CD